MNSSGPKIAGKRESHAGFPVIFIILARGCDHLSEQFDRTRSVTLMQGDTNEQLIHLVLGRGD